MKRAALIVPVVILIAASCSESDPAPTATISTTSTTTTAASTTQGGVMELTSPDFQSEGPIPARFACDGADESPELNIAGIPQDTVSLVLIMDDPDASVGTFDHWVAFDIEPTEVIPANVGDLGTGGAELVEAVGLRGAVSTVGNPSLLLQDPGPRHGVGPRGRRNEGRRARSFERARARRSNADGHLRALSAETC